MFLLYLVEGLFVILTKDEENIREIVKLNAGKNIKKDEQRKEDLHSG